MPLIALALTGLLTWLAFGFPIALVEGRSVGIADLIEAKRTGKLSEHPSAAPRFVRPVSVSACPVVDQDVYLISTRIGACATWPPGRSHDDALCTYTSWEQ